MASQRTAVVSPMPAAANTAQAGVLSSSFNLAKSIIGMGVLSLPSGLAFVTDDRAAVIPAAAMCALYGSLSAYSFSVIGRVCDMHGAVTFPDAYRATVSNSTALVVPILTASTCLLNALACSIMIGDSFSEMLRSAGAPSLVASRNGALALITATVLAPLCMLRSLKALAPLSVLGLIGTLFTALMMGVRYLDGSYSYGYVSTEGLGRFLAALPAASRPSFNVFRRNTGEWHSLLSAASFVLLSMFNTAFVAHYHAPRIYAELKEKTTQNFNLITKLSFGLSTAVFIFMMVAGFLTFGGNSNGFILNNYASSDRFASLSRLAVGLSLVSGYPILFSALRDGLLDLVGARQWAASRPKLTAGGSMLLLWLLTALAMRFRDVSFLVSFTGALCGSALVYVIPALMSMSMESSRERSVYSDLLDVEYSAPYWENTRPKPEMLRQMDRLNRQMFDIRLRKALSYLMLLLGIAMSIGGVLVCVLREAGVELGAN